MMMEGDYVKRNYFKKHEFQEENEEQGKHKTRQEMKRVINIQRMMQTSSLRSTVSQFMITGPTLRKEICVYWKAPSQ